VSTSLENLDASASYFRSLFASDEYLERPERLGILGMWSPKLAFETWAGSPLEPASWDSILIQMNVPTDLAFDFDEPAARADVEAFFLTLEKIGVDRPALQ
jgi:hypothetical protein